MPTELTIPDDVPIPAPSDSPITKDSLDRSLLVGIAWTGGMKWGTQILSWATTLVVARILTPADYGIMGMATVYLGFVALINEFGLTAAILQQRGMAEDQIARLGGFGILGGAAFTLLSMAMAVPIARFYGEPAVAGVVLWLSLDFTVTSVGVLPRALLARDLQFHRLAWANGISAVVQMTATVGMALAGFRYYALVFGSLIGSAVVTLVLLTWRRHRLAWPRSFATISQALHVGWHVVVGRVAWYSYQNADFAIVGRVLGKTALGAYSLGWTIASVPVERISAMVGQVTPGVFSAVQTDPAALRRYYLGIIEGLAFLTLPAAMGIALTAHAFVPLLLGPRWLTAILPLEILAFYGGIRSVDTVAPQILVYTGHSRQAMRYSIFAALTLPVLFYVGTRWGAAGVAAAWVIGYPFVVIPGYRLLFRILHLSPVQFIRTLWPPVSGTLAMAAVVGGIRLAFAGRVPVVIELVAEVAAGAVTYAGLMYLAHRERLRAFVGALRRVRGG